VADLLDRIDPELAGVVLSLPDRVIGDIPGQRARTTAMLRELRAGLSPSSTVVRGDHVIPGRHPADPPVTVRVYRPTAAAGMLGALCWIHGGGYVSGSVDQDDAVCEAMVDEVGCAVISVEWRLAPEHPFPAAVDDAFACLRWAASSSSALAIDRKRIVVGGASSGAGTAAAVALMARDLDGPPLAGQLLLYPMLDDRPPTMSCQMITSPKVWNVAANEQSWRSYLGPAYGTDDVSPYAAPARAVDLRGLPPAFIAVGQIDLFVHEDIVFAQRLIDAGGDVELHVYAGAVHGFDILAPHTAIARRLLADRNVALRRYLAPSSSEGVCDG
jgi:acetyl esterase/lipase